MHENHVLKIFARAAVAAMYPSQVSVGGLYTPVGTAQLGSGYNTVQAIASGGTNLSTGAFYSDGQHMNDAGYALLGAQWAFDIFPFLGLGSYGGSGNNANGNNGG